MRVIRIATFLTVVIAAQAAAQSPAATAAATITPQDVRMRIEFLASDQLRGRDTPSPGLEMAAEWAAKEFAAYGLKPGGDNGSFIQRWAYRVSTFDAAKVKVELRGPTPKELAYGKEFFVIPSPALDTIAGGVVFAGTAGGTATTQPMFKDNIAVYYMPGAMPERQWESALNAAFTTAYTGGARGIILILDPGFQEAIIGMVAQMAGGQSAPLPLLALRYDAARDWLKTYNVDLDAARISTDPNVFGKASFFMRTSDNAVESRPPNVVGILEGSDPQLKNTYIVYSAHIDHVGVGAPDASGDSIYNGADDDASGTTAVLEIAQAFSSMKQRPKRSIIFALVSGEEKGLYGSAHFVKNPPVPAKQIIANINIDMIGRNSPDTTVAIGQDYSSLGPTMQAVVKAHPELKLTVAPDLWPDENLFVRSDHFNFAKAEIPAIFFTSGLHADYHKPSDEPGTIDNDKLTRTAKLLFYLGNEVANSAAVPTWTEAGLKVVR